MRSRPKRSDRPGYAYAFEVFDHPNDDILRIKAGRTCDPNRRMKQHWRTCGASLKPRIFDVCPPPAGGSDAHTLFPGKIQPGAPAPYATLLEELIHLELADYSENAPYLNPSFPKATSGGKRLGPKPRSARCTSCGCALIARDT